jgi:hypothetical protein
MSFLRHFVQMLLHAVPCRRPPLPTYSYQAPCCRGVPYLTRVIRRGSANRRLTLQVLLVKRKVGLACRLQDQGAALSRLVSPTRLVK